MFQQRLGLPESKPAGRKFWVIQTTDNDCSFHSKWHSVSELQCHCFANAINKDMGLVTCNANGSIKNEDQRPP